MVPLLLACLLVRSHSSSLRTPSLIIVTVTTTSTTTSTTIINQSPSITTRYQLQDLRCSKCLKVAKRQLGLHCTCSGKLECDDGPMEFASDLRV
jgi:hypothetical protein